MKSTLKSLTILAVLATSSFAFADSSSLVGRWRTVGEFCEVSGDYINGYLEQTTYAKITAIYPDGTIAGEQRSTENSASKVVVTFKGKYQLNGNVFAQTITQAEVNGVTQPTGAKTIATISLTGNILKLSHKITEPNRACPVGDSAVTIMSRL